MAATTRLLNFIRHSSSLRPTVSRATTIQQQIRWYCVKFDDKYYEKLVKDRPVVLFMKGVPSAPMCGFSRLVVQILHMHGVERYDHYNVLEDVDFKEGMKKYSNWPTFPQLYMNGELVGGSDILLQLHQNGELIEELKKGGHRSVLLDKDNKDNN